MIPGCPNGETRRGATRVTSQDELTRGTETSKYPEEEKATAIPLVAASERGPAQTGGACSAGVVGPHTDDATSSERVWKGRAIEGDSPVA